MTTTEPCGAMPCDAMCPFLGCLTCAYSGGVATPPNQDVSAGQTGCEPAKLRARKTAPAGNRGLTTETSEESKWL